MLPSSADRLKITRDRSLYLTALDNSRWRVLGCGLPLAGRTLNKSGKGWFGRGAYLDMVARWRQAAAPFHACGMPCLWVGRVTTVDNASSF